MEEKANAALPWQCHRPEEGHPASSGGHFPRGGPARVRTFQGPNRACPSSYGDHIKYTDARNMCQYTFKILKHCLFICPSYALQKNACILSQFICPTLYILEIGLTIREITIWHVVNQKPVSPKNISRLILFLMKLFRVSCYNTFTSFAVKKIVAADDYFLVKLASGLRIRQNSSDCSFDSNPRLRKFTTTGSPSFGPVPPLGQLPPLYTHYALGGQ